MGEGKVEGDGGEERQEKKGKLKGKEEMEAQRKAQLSLRVHSGAQTPPQPHTLTPRCCSGRTRGGTPWLEPQRDPGVTRAVTSPHSPLCSPTAPGCRDKAQICGTRPGCASCCLRGALQGMGAIPQPDEFGVQPQREGRAQSPALPSRGDTVGPLGPPPAPGSAFSSAQIWGMHPEWSPRPWSPQVAPG